MTNIYHGYHYVIMSYDHIVDEGTVILGEFIGDTLCITGFSSLERRICKWNVGPNFDGEIFLYTPAITYPKRSNHATTNVRSI